MIDTLNDKRANKFANLTHSCLQITQCQPMKGNRWWPIPLLIFVVGLAVFLPSLGLTGLIDPSDAFFAESAREMVESGDYITPMLNYDPYNNKPILTNWLICLAYKIIGVSPLASRVPSALCAILTCVALYLFARRFLSKRASLLSSSVLLSSTLFIAIGRVSLTDMPLTLMVNIALFSLFSGLELNCSKLKNIGFIALGLAFLAKGPIALFITVGAFLLYFIATTPGAKPKDVLAKFHLLSPLKALSIVLAINLPWFIAVGIATHGAFIRDFFVTENLMRAMGKITMPHSQPFYFYAPIVLGGFFPWTVFLLASAPSIAKWWHARKAPTARVRLLLFCGATIATIFGGFSLLTGKLPTYVLPLFPALAIITGTGIDSLIKCKPRRILLATAVLLSICAVGVLIGVQFALSLRSGMQIWVNSLCSVCVAAYLIYALLIWHGKVKLAMYEFAGTWLILAALTVPTIFQLFYNHHQRCFADLLQDAKAMKMTVCEIAEETPSAPFYLGKHVPSLKNYFDLVYILSISKGEILILCEDRYEHLAKEAPVARLLKRNKQFCLYAVADPDKQMLRNYFEKVHSAEIAHRLDSTAPDPSLIITKPSRSVR